jgi:hypothetical protein
MQRIPNRFRAHNILKPGISRVTVAYIIDVLDYGNLLVSRGRNHRSTALGEPGACRILPGSGYRS